MRTHPLCGLLLIGSIGFNAPCVAQDGLPKTRQDAVRNVTDEPERNDAEAEEQAIKDRMEREMRRLSKEGPPPSEREVALYRERLLAHSRAWSAWLTDRCELDSSQQIAELLEQVVTEQTQSFSEMRLTAQNNRNMPVCIPVSFVLPDGPASQFRTAAFTRLNALLSEPQQTRLQAALQEQRQFRHAALAGYFANLLDGELFLTPQQKDQLIKLILRQPDEALHSLYQLRPVNHYLPIQSLTELIPFDESSQLLTPEQLARFRDFNFPKSSDSFTFDSSKGPESWRLEVTEKAQRHRDQVLRAADVRIACLQRELPLTAEQRKRLRTASKGAALSLVDEWKDLAWQTVGHMEQQLAQFNGRVSFGAPPFDVNDLNTSDVWRSALQSLDASVLARPQSESRAALAEMLTAELDAELWLLPDQRDRLRQLLLETLPASDTPSSQDYIKPLVQLALPLFKTTDEQRAGLLTELQQNVWKQMQAYFKRQAGSNYVEIPLRNGLGGIGVMLPD
jgi:hypothetical protein